MSTKKALKLKAKTVRQHERYARLGGSAEPTEIGLRQFVDYESRGVFPDDPCPYFRRLLDGKKWWEWTVNEYASLYGTMEWFGWYQLEADFRNDVDGLRQIAQRVKRRFRGLTYRVGDAGNLKAG